MENLEKVCTVAICLARAEAAGFHPTFAEEAAGSELPRIPFRVALCPKIAAASLGLNVVGRHIPLHRVAVLDRLSESREQKSAPAETRNFV